MTPHLTIGVTESYAWEAMVDRSSLKVRFDDESFRLLRILSSSLGVSMNRLARDMVTRESHVLAAGLELDMAETLAALNAFRAPSHEAQAAEFAEAEVENEDPLRSRHVGSALPDPYGVEAAFAHTVER